MQQSTRVQKKDSLTVFMHWALVISLVFSLLTGLRISSDAEDSVWARALDGLLLQGDVISLHILAAFGLAFVAISYCVFLIRARVMARLSLDSSRLKDLRSADRRKRWTTINVILIWLAFLLIMLAAITGTLLYVAPDLFSYELVSGIHQLVPWLILLYVPLHVTAELILGGMRQLLKILNPSAAHGSAAVFAMVVGVPTVGTLYGLDKLSIKDLPVAHTTEAPRMDGDPSDAVWHNAKRVSIHTTRGQNLPGGEVTVQLRALHDTHNLYLLLEWPDTTRSQKFLPLVKTAEGWKVLQRRYAIKDEDKFYEDKMAVMLARTPEIAGAGTTHLGPQPLAGKPGPAGGRGLHLTTNGSIADVWHWKSVRTGTSAMNQADDNYFGPPMEPKSDKKRYTGGYTKDPKLAGGFSLNWEEFSEGIVQPRR